MGSMIKYKGYIGSVEFSQEDGLKKEGLNNYIKKKNLVELVKWWWYNYF